MKGNKNKKRKVKYKNVSLLLFIVIVLLGICFFITSTRIKNIYITGNSILTDQEIIDEVGIRKYPKIISLNKKKMSAKLEENMYVNKAKISYSLFTQEIHIDIVENRPLLYYQYEDTYLLSDASRVKVQYALPVLINQTPEDILEKLLNKLFNLDDNILGRISEIKYVPTDVDDNLFELIMNDGNLVYINFNSFNKLNDYPEYIRSFDNRKGILHLDSGDYLEIFK